MKKYATVRTAALCLVLCLLLSVTAFAAVPKPSSDFYVNDYVGVLKQSTKDAIISKNDDLQRRTGAQIVVAVIEDTNGLSMPDYSYEMANQWGIGDAEKDNGVLLLLSIGDDDYQCIQGRGLERLLPTSTISRILQEKLEPDFAAKDYDSGVYKTFLALYDEVDSIYAGTSGNYDPEESTAVSMIKMVALLVIVLILISLFTSRRRIFSPWGRVSSYSSGYAAGRRAERRSSYHSSYRPSHRSGGGGSFRSSSHSHRSGGGGSFRGGGAGRGH